MTVEQSSRGIIAEISKAFPVIMMSKKSQQNTVVRTTKYLPQSPPRYNNAAIEKKKRGGKSQYLPSTGYLLPPTPSIPPPIPCTYLCPPPDLSLRGSRIGTSLSTLLFLLPAQRGDALPGYRTLCALTGSGTRSAPAAEGPRGG